MRKLIFLSLFSTLFIISSCDDDSPNIEQTGKIELIVKANYNGELFQTQKEYEYIPGMLIKFTEFDFYVANINLLEDENSTDETELSDVDFINLSFDVTQTDQALLGDTISTKNVPVGSYSAFKIGFGLPADLNRTRPSDYGEGDVMNTATHFWSPLNSYIFSKIEGFSDNNGNGIFEATEGEGIRFHLGQDEVYTERILYPTDPIVIKDGETLKLILNIDVKKLFNMPLDQFDVNGDNLLDIEVHNESHGDTEAQEFMIDKQLMRNFSDAITLEQ
jgi:methanobactin biosynthesis MbnP-like protein